MAFTNGNGIQVIEPMSGATPQNVTTDGDDVEAGWSPDGKRLVFATGDAGARHIATVRADGTDRTDLTGGADEVSPAWSPDGERIVFTRTDFGGAGGHLMTIPAGGGTPVDLTTPSAVHTDLQADWQPILEPEPRPPRPDPAPAPTPVPIAPSFTG